MSKKKPKFAITMKQNEIPYDGTWNIAICMTVILWTLVEHASRQVVLNHAQRRRPKSVRTNKIKGWKIGQGFTTVYLASAISVVLFWKRLADSPIMQSTIILMCIFLDFREVCSGKDQVWHGCSRRSTGKQTWNLNVCAPTITVCNMTRQAQVIQF